MSNLIQMSNLELLINPYIDQVYITSTNMITPLTTITFDGLYQSVISFFNVAINILQISIQTATFIFVEAFKNLTVEKILYIIGLYNLFMLVFLDNQTRKITKQKEQIESLDKKIIYLKKTDRMREDLEEVWIQDIKAYHEETSKKMTAMEKKIKKFEKNLKQYE